MARTAPTGPLGSEPAVTTALQPRITEAVFSAVPPQPLITEALPADRAFLAVLCGDAEAVQIEGDTVTLNLLLVVNRVLGQLEDVASGLLGQDVDLPTITSGEVPKRARDRLDSALGLELPVLAALVRSACRQPDLTSTVSVMRAVNVCHSARHRSDPPAPRPGH